MNAFFRGELSTEMTANIYLVVSFYWEYKEKERDDKRDFISEIF